MGGAEKLSFRTLVRFFFDQQLTIRACGAELRWQQLRSDVDAPALARHEKARLFQANHIFLIAFVMKTLPCVCLLFSSINSNRLAVAFLLKYARLKKPWH